MEKGSLSVLSLLLLHLDGTQVYQLLGDIKLDFDDSHSKFNKDTYQRVLDLDTATVKVQYSVNGVDFVREHFVSNPDNVIVIKISANKPASLNFTVCLDSQMHHHSYVNGKNQIIMSGSCPRTIGSGTESIDNAKGIQYSAILELQISGDSGELQVVDSRKLRIKNSDRAVIRFAASSSFDGPFTKPADSTRDPESAALSTMNLVKRFSYADLYTRHVDDFQSLFHRVSLQLSRSAITGINLNSSEVDNDTITSAQRVHSFKMDEDPYMVELLFQYGRYLMISSSRPGTQVSNLQGIWNSYVHPPWEYVLSLILTRILHQEFI